MKLTLLFGGQSYEHEISIVSAITVKQKLSTFDLNYVFCDDKHDFYLIEEESMKASYFSSYEYKKSQIVTIGNDGFSYKKLFGSNTFKNPVLNIIHGGDGEDATIASLLEFYSFEFIGPRKAASVFSYDKRYTKYLADARNIKTLSYQEISRQNRDVKFDVPFIVKPSTLGSSIGVSIIKELSQLNYALDVAFEFDNSAIVEPFIDGVKEYNLAGCKVNGEYIFSIIEEPNKDEFLDFDKKYLDFSRSSAINKADISDELELNLKESFKKVYDDLFEGALIRCDFFVIDYEVYLNEINPIPGSMANYLFEDFEKSIRELLVSLPSKKEIKVSYNYINSINQAKGK